jgi:hypothetical protein
MEGGRLNDDSVPSYNQLYFILNYKRAQYLRQDQTKRWFDMDTIYQDLGVLEFEKVDSAESCGFESGCNIYRTKLEIPDVLRFDRRYGIKVSAIDKQLRCEIILPERMPFVKFTKYPSLTKKLYLLNNRLYTDSIFGLNIRIAATDPRKVRIFTDANCEPCYTDDSEYPLPDDIITLITTDVFNNELKILLSITPDDTNDSQDDNRIPRIIPPTQG